jgi:hypothetical protein
MKCMYCGCGQVSHGNESNLKPYGPNDGLVCINCFAARPDIQRAYVESHRDELGVPEGAIIQEIGVIQVGPHGPGCDCDWPKETVH